jgi:hypothetical protein
MQLSEFKMGDVVRFGPEATDKFAAVITKQYGHRPYSEVGSRNEIRRFNTANAAGFPLAIGNYPLGREWSWSLSSMPDVYSTEAELAPNQKVLTDGGYKRFVAFPDRCFMLTGADPEFFVTNAKGKVIPAFSFLPAQSRDTRVYEDGFQAEMAPAPRACHQELFSQIQFCMNDLRRAADQQGGTISSQNFVTLTTTELRSGTAKQVSLGCRESSNIYGEAPFVGVRGRTFPYRMAGGHIHFGVEESAPYLHKHAKSIIQAMDVFLGVASVSMFEGMEDPQRRMYYGRAGEYREQKHGLEYRTLSNAWLYHPDFVHPTLQLARAAFRLGCMHWEQLIDFDPQEIRRIINNYDVAAARVWMKQHAKLYCWMLRADGLSRGQAMFAFKEMLTGYVNKWPGWADVSQNWANVVFRYLYEIEHRYTHRKAVAPLVEPVADVPGMLPVPRSEAFRAVSSYGERAG